MNLDVSWLSIDKSLIILVMYAIMILCGTIFAAHFIRHVLYNVLVYTQRKKERLHERLRNQGKQVTDYHPVFDETKYRIISRLLTGIIYIIGLGFIVWLVPSLRSLSVSILAGAGITAVIIGFALQRPMENIFSGLFIALYEPFRIGDAIQVDGKYGVVEDITLRHTVVRNWENRRFVIPNGQMSQLSIENYSIIDSTFLRVFKVGISYESDIDLARKVILEEMAKHENIISVDPHQVDPRAQNKPFVRVSAWLDSGIELQIGFWVSSVGESWHILYELQESIKKRFDKEGIEIPYPHRSIVMKKGRSFSTRGAKKKK